MPVQHDNTMALQRQKRHIRKNLSRVLLSLLAVVFVFASVPFVDVDARVTQDDINALKQKQAEITSSKKDIQGKISAAQSEKAKATQQKALLEEQIEVIRQELNVTNNLIDQLNRQIEEKTAELEEAKAEEARYFDLFCDRVRDLEEGGDINYLSVLFDCSDFSDLLDQLNLIGEIAEYDNNVMDALAAAREKVANAKAELETARVEEQNAKAQLESSQAELNQQQASVSALVSEIQSQEDQYQGQLSSLEMDSVDLSNEIASAEKLYAAQIAAAKKAEQERIAAAAAAEAAAKQQQQNGTGGISTGGTSTGGTSTGGTSTGGTSTGGTSNTGNNVVSRPNTNNDGGGNVVVGSGGYSWPLPGYSRVSSPYGWRTHPVSGGQSFHGGIDVPAPSGTPIVSAKSGTVVISSFNGSYGNYVVVAHNDGSKTLYAHMVSRAVGAGSSVSQGQTIGYVGTTGSSTGNHLHFEVWTGSTSGTRTNPMNYF